MKRHHFIWGILAGILGVLPVPAMAQSLEQEGKLQLDMVNVMIDESEVILSNGPLAGLETDPNFTGDWGELSDSATSLLANHTTVTRGGHFPENRGIPLSEQLTIDECVYRIFQLENGNELMIYQSPQSETVQYLIRGVN